MDIKSIKNRANEVLVPYRSQLIRVLLIVLVLNAIPSIFTGDNFLVGLLSLVATFVFLPVSHGITVSTLKIVRNMGHTVNDEDGFVGFKRFGELFPTYIITTLVIFVVVFIFVLVLGLILALIMGSSIGIISSLAGGDAEAMAMALLMNPGFLLSILVFILLVIVFSIVLEACFMAVPYLLEQYHITGFNAVKTSFAMMKGHIFDFVKLYFSFFGWIFLSSLISSLLTEILPISLVVSIVVSLFQVYTYLPLFYTSQAVLFEEIAFYHFNQVGEQSEIDA